MEWKKFLFLEEGSPETISYLSAMVVVLTDKVTSGASREKLIPGEYTVLYSGKIRLKPRLFPPAILAGNSNPGTSSALPGLVGG